jgi:hypothetical protein
MDHNIDGLTIAGQSFVDTVIDDFIDQMVKTSGTGATDVHPGTLTNRVQSF